MAKRKKAPKRNRYATKTRKELDVRANVKAKIRRMKREAADPGVKNGYNYADGFNIGWRRFADELLEFIATMDDRANAKRGGGGVR